LSGSPFKPLVLPGVSDSFQHLKNFLKEKLGCFYTEKKDRKALSYAEYNNQFMDCDISLSKKNMKRLKEAYKKAWECRDFEINKFWTRSAFFGGIIVIIFTGYTTLITNYQNPNLPKYLDFYLLLLGYLFSLAWLLVIKGSKAWQENWEAHIDYLENFISGPLYKLVWLPRKYKYYSVSKINEVLAIITIFAWVGMIFQYLVTHYNICIPNLSHNWESRIDIPITLNLFISISIAFSIVLLIGYPAGKYKFDRGSLEIIEVKNKKGAFINRYEKGRAGHF
jgi:hypothetical protein